MLSGKLVEKKGGRSASLSEQTGSEEERRGVGAGRAPHVGRVSCAR